VTQKPIFAGVIGVGFLPPNPIENGPSHIQPRKRPPISMELARRSVNA